jgi:uncharacterized protein YaaN involved in tellurite resistance
MALKTNDYGNDLKLQMALKETQKFQDRVNDRVQDLNHLDTVEHFSPYGK